MIWAFWAAAGLAAVAGLMPLVFAGPSTRLGGALIPFVVAALAFGACALTYGQGRIFTAIIYFIAGLAVVFALLSLFSLPLRLAVLGTCPAAPAPCPTGLPRPLSDAENTGMGVASVMGILAVFVGFLGLAVLYRRPSVPASSMPPTERRIPPVTSPPRRAEEPAPETAPSTPPEVRAGEPEPPELPEAEEPELPPHEEAELPELPAPESESSTA